MPVCYRCSTTNPLINVDSHRRGDACVNCGHPFLRSFASFDSLPLVQFFPEADIPEEEVLALIAEMPAAGAGGALGDADGWKEGGAGGAQTLSLGDDDAPSGGVRAAARRGRALMGG